MPARLRDLVIDEVSLVDRPANPQAKVVLYKRDTEQPAQKGGQRLDEPTLKERLWSFVKGLVAKEGDAVSFDEALAEQQAQRWAAKATEALWDLFWALRQSVESILADDSVADKKAAIAESVAQFQQAIAEQLGALNEMPVDKAGRKISAERLARLKAMRDELSRLIEEAETPTAKGGANVPEQVRVQENQAAAAGPTVAAASEDVAKGDLPEAVRKRLEDLEKRAREADERAKRAEEMLRAEREIRLKREFAEKAARYAPLGVDREAFGELLRKLAEKAPEEYAELEKALDRAAEAARASDALLAEIGKSAAPDEDSAWGRVEKMARERVAKSNGTLTLEQAVDQVLRENPDLAREYVREVR